MSLTKKFLPRLAPDFQIQYPKLQPLSRRYLGWNFFLLLLHIDDATPRQVIKLVGAPVLSRNAFQMKTCGLAKVSTSKNVGPGFLKHRSFFRRISERDLKANKKLVWLKTMDKKSFQAAIESFFLSLPELGSVPGIFCYLRPFFFFFSPLT
jgi:hypothetical protein